MKRVIISILCLMSIGLAIVGCTDKTATTLETNKAREANEAKAENKTQAANNKDAGKKALVYPGTVQKVKPDLKVIEVRKENRALALAFDASQAKCKGFKDIKDLKYDDKVIIEYAVSGGKAVALTVTKK